MLRHCTDPAKCARTFSLAFFFYLQTHTHTRSHTPAGRRLGWLLTRHGMAVEVVPYGLLEFMIRRPLLEPLVEEMSQVLVESSSYKKYTKQHMNKSWASLSREPSKLCVRKQHPANPAQRTSVIAKMLQFPAAGEKQEECNKGKTA